MSKIEVRHTSIVVNNYDFGDCRKLENYFSIFDRAYFTTRYIGIYYDAEKRQLYLPRGIDIYFVERLLCESAVLNSHSDPYDKITVKLKYKPKDDVQKEALRFMLGLDQYKDNKVKSQLSVNLNTGAGKTYCTIAAMAFLGIKTIIITSQKGWLEQWKDRIVEYTDIKPKEIFTISGSSTVTSLMTRDNSKYKVYLCSDATLRSYANSNGWDSITELFKNIKVGIKAFDEAHLHFDNMAMIDYHTNVALTYYVTATPARSDEDENRIYSYYFKNVPKIDLFDEDNDPRSKYLAIMFNSHPSVTEIEACKNMYGMDRNAYINYVVYKPAFKQLLHLIVDICKRTNGKVLIYIGTNNAIKEVYEWMVSNYPELDNRIGIYTSVVTEYKAEQLDKKIILSTTKSCGAAVDIKGLKKTIVLAEPFKSEVLARQTLGRTRDRDTVYIEIVDEGFSSIKRYYRSKQQVFSKYATECIAVRFNDFDLSRKAEELAKIRDTLTNVVSFRDMAKPMIDVVKFRNHGQ